MPTVKITKSDGQVFEVSELSLEQIKELVGTNGHVGRKTKSHAISLRPSDFQPNYVKFKKHLTDKGKKFLQILRENPNGIARDNLAEKLGFHTGTQIGGMTGGGIAKRAEKYGLEVTDIYTVEVKRVDGERVVTYKPGKEIARVL